MNEWNISRLLTWTGSYFQSKDIDSPRLTAEVLLAFCLGFRRLDLYLQHDRPLNKKELSYFKELIQRRVAHEPVAYIVGEKGFFQSDFYVNSGVLIPRPETELLVEKALEFLSGFSAGRVLDLGTGSGAIVVSLAKENPAHEFWAVDISQEALCVASLNANHLSSVPVNFVQSSWMDCLKPEPAFNLIVANPPYIPTKDIDELSPVVRLHEPGTALDGGENGLDSISIIIQQAALRMLPGAILLMETGFDQKESVEQLILAHGGYEAPVFFKDLSGHDRIVQIQSKSDS